MLLHYVENYCRKDTAQVIKHECPSNRQQDSQMMPKFTALTSFLWDGKHIKLLWKLQACRSAKMYSLDLNSQHTLILCTSRAQILQQVLVRRAGVCQILMQPCYRPLQRFQSRKQGSGVLLNIVTMNLT